MPRKPKPKLQVGSPRQKRTVLDDSTFDALAARAEQTSSEKPEEAREPELPSERPEASAPAKQKRATRRSGADGKVANRKGRNGQPYVRKRDGIATVPQYLTLPADLAKRLKIHAIENDTKVSLVAEAALEAYLSSQ